MSLKQIAVLLTFACLSTNQVAAQTAAGARALMTRYRRDFIASCTPTMPTTTSSISAKSMCGCMVDKILVNHIKAHRSTADLPPLVLGSRRAEASKTECLMAFSNRGSRS